MPIAGYNTSVMNSDIITTTFNVATASTIVEEGGVDDPTTFNVATTNEGVECW
jgi:hypothetical protein